MTIGDKIKRGRKAMGLTQAQAAKIMGCTQQYWSGLENDRTAPGIDTLAPVAAVLGCRLSVLFIPTRGYRAWVP